MNHLNKLRTIKYNLNRKHFAVPSYFISKYSTIKSENQSVHNGNENNGLELTPKKNTTFAQKFRRSKFVALGDLENKVLIGRVFDVIGDDLYIDYGGKFNAVCKNPENNFKDFTRNANVKVELVDFEMASFFLSAAKHLTLLESNARIVGYFWINGLSSDESERNGQLKQDTLELNSESYY